MATKSIFPADSSLQYNNDGTFVLIETWHVNGMTSTTEAAARLEALTAVNVDIQTTKSITYDGLTQALTMQTATVRILSGHTAAGAQGQAIVTIHWGRMTAHALTPQATAAGYSRPIPIRPASLAA